MAPASSSVREQPRPELADPNRSAAVAHSASAVSALQTALGNRAFSALLQRDLVDDTATQDPGSSLAAPHKGKKSGATTTVGTTTTVPKVVAAKPWTAKDVALWKSKKKRGDDVITELAKRDSANGVALVKAGGDWDRVVGGLKEGVALSKETKAAMWVLVETGAVAEEDAKRLFKKRFKHGMTEHGAAWTMANIQGVWKQLDLLPESDVSQNTVLTTFRAMGGGGGFGPSWEAKDTINTIDLGDAIDPASMSHTVRHEVAHGVHAQIEGPINAWLKDDMGMWFGGFDTAGVDEFVNALGGYPATFNKDGADTPWTDTATQWIRHLISTYTGNASWDPTLATPDTGADAWVTAYWAAMDPKLRNACAQSTSHWYQNYENFQVGQGGNRYFLNHWYHRWFKMSPIAKSVIDATGEKYTAMSEKEFFANAYAEYFADPKGKKDPSKWGGRLPQTVKDFFLTCIVKRDPYTTFAKKNKKAKTTKAKK